MDTTKRQAADKVRPILAAMERSIDSARRRRLHIEEDPPAHNNIASGQQSAQPMQNSAVPQPIDKRDELIAVPNRSHTNANHGTPNRQNSENDQPEPGKARLKARPKRPVGFSSGPDQPFYGAKAG